MREAGYQVIGESGKSDLPVVKSFEDLLVWQQGRRLVKEVYLLTKILPAEEKFGLISQMRRAAVSVPLNIAEGHSRNSRKEYLHFLSISVGSLAELKTLFILCVDLEYLSPEKIISVQDLLDKTVKMIRNLQRKLKNPDSSNP